MSLQKLKTIYPRRRIPAERRFIAKVVITDSCWLWTGGKTTLGYGVMGVGSKSGGDYRHVMAYRFGYEAMIGPIPKGLELDHLCRNPSCVNPAHLEPVTHRENMLRGLNNLAAKRAVQTHCVHGHPFDEANTKVTARGSRKCRTCHRTAERVRQRRKRAMA